MSRVAPGFFFFTNDWNGSRNVRAMTLEERMAYLNLLIAQWGERNGMLPCDDEELREISELSKEKWDTCKKRLLKNFVCTDNDEYVYNEKLYSQWEKSAQFKARGSAAAVIRWAKTKDVSKGAPPAAGTAPDELTPSAPVSESKPEKPAAAPWRGSFEEYRKMFEEAKNDLCRDDQEIEKQQKYYPNIDIRLSVEKSFENFWGTEAGWTFCKKKRPAGINARQTLINNIDKNKVYQPRDQQTNSGSTGRHLDYL